MRRVLYLLFLIEIVFFASNHVIAQTGPAGVGSSTNNVLWLKADAGISTSTDGTPISTWNDQSGNGINVSQSNASQKPLYKAALMNGNPAVEFDNNNTAGQNDLLTAPDNSLLDNTNGYSFFTVTRMKNLDGSTARSIVSKRTTIDTDEAFMLFYYTNNYFYTDIDGLGDRFNTPAPAYVNNTNYIIDVSYDGSLAAGSRSKIFEGETLRKTASETSSSVPDKVSPLVIGATHSSDTRAFGGYMSEVIIYRTALNDASRIIVNNYLSAKYDIAISANDKYAGDNSVNGDYDRNVAGIGKESSGSNNAFASSVSAGLGMIVNSGLDNNDYIIAGNAVAINALNTTDVGGMTGTNNARWLRTWYVDVTNTSSDINVNLEFDANDAGMAGAIGDATEYVLLYRVGQSGNWTELMTASDVSGEKIQFNSITITNDGYYTIGTKNIMVSPLPVVLINFTAAIEGKNIGLSWATSSEEKDDSFTVEKSKDGISFEQVVVLAGAGNSKTIHYYASIDESPFQGLSYYRLKQTDVNGNASYSSVISVNNRSESNITMYPNPASSEGPIYMLIASENKETITIVVRDIFGKEVYTQKAISFGEPMSINHIFDSGIYIVTTSGNYDVSGQRLVVK